MEEEEEDKLNFIYVGNYKIDYATLKMILYCVEPCDIDTLKLYHNNLDEFCLKTLFT